MFVFGWLFNIVEWGRVLYDRVFFLLKEENLIEEVVYFSVEMLIGNIEVVIYRFLYGKEDVYMLNEIYFIFFCG